MSSTVKIFWGQREFLKRWKISGLKLVTWIHTSVWAVLHAALCTVDLFAHQNSLKFHYLAHSYVFQVNATMYCNYLFWQFERLYIIFNLRQRYVTSLMWSGLLTRAAGSLSPVSCSKPQCNPFIRIERYASTLSSLLLTADLWTLPVGKWALHDITRRSQLLGSFTAHYYMGDNACYIIQLTEACAPWVEESVKRAAVYTLGIH